MNWREELKKYPKFAPDFDLDPHSTALLPIDMQYYDAHPDYCHVLDNYPDVHAYYFGRLQDVVIPNHIRLINFFRQNNLRIVYVTYGPMLPDGSDYVPLRRKRFDEMMKETGRTTFFPPPNSFERGILEEIKPKEGELVLNKPSGGVFNTTRLERILLNMGIDGLIITGVVTNACVENSARAAADLNFKAVLVDDACATYSQEVHDATMLSYAMICSKVATTAEVIAYLSERLGV